MQAHKALERQLRALSLSTKYHIPLGEDFHTLRNDVVDRIIAAADERKYRKPKNANGSRARYFYAQLNRDAARAFAGFV